MISLDRFIYNGRPLSTPAPEVGDARALTPEQRRHLIAEQMAHQQRLWAIAVLRQQGFLPRNDSMTP